MHIGFAWQGFVWGWGGRGGPCELLPEAPSLSSRGNGSWHQDRPLSRVWGSWACSGLRRDDWEGTSAVTRRIWRWGCQETRARLCSVVPSNRQRQWQEVMHRKLRLNVRENFLTVQVSEHWNRLPREDVRLPSLETGELSGCNLMSCALGWTCWNRGVTPDDHCGPFQLGPFCEEWEESSPARGRSSRDV